jgi:hypothetical protein
MGHRVAMYKFGLDKQQVALLALWKLGQVRLLLALQGVLRSRPAAAVEIQVPTFRCHLVRPQQNAVWAAVFL